MRVALAGYGLAGEVFHAPLVAATDGLELAVVVTTDSRRRERALAAHPGARVVESIEAAWALEPELLVVATPNRSHVPLALAAIERGVAVVVDKPLAAHAEDAARLVAAAEAAGVGLTVFQNRRWDGDFLTLRALLAEGALGPPIRLESRFERFRPAVGAGWRELAGEPEGGGLLLDLGSHLVDQARELLGAPVRVYAELDRRRSRARVEDDVFVALEHPGGARSHLWMSATAPLHGSRFALWGLDGGLACDGLDPQEAQLAAGIRPGAPEYGRRPPGRRVDGAGERPQELLAGDYPAFYAGVRDWLAGAGPPPVDPSDAVAVLEILAAARRSAAAGEVVRLVTP